MELVRDNMLKMYCEYNKYITDNGVIKSTLLSANFEVKLLAP